MAFMVSAVVASGAVMSLPPANRVVDSIETHRSDETQVGETTKITTLDLVLETVKVFRYKTREIGDYKFVVGLEVVWKAKLYGTQILDIQDSTSVDVGAIWSWDEEREFEPETRNPLLDCFAAISDNFPKSVPPDLQSPLGECIPEPNALLLSLLGISVLLLRRKL